MYIRKSNWTSSANHMNQIVADSKINFIAFAIVLLEYIYIFCTLIEFLLHIECYLKYFYSLWFSSGLTKFQSLIISWHKGGLF